MKTEILIIGILVIMLNTGCAARNKDIIIDPTNVDMGLYQSDLAYCQQLADQVDSKVGANAVGGAAAGGLIGAAFGNSNSMKKGAAIGAIAGTARGARAKKREKLKVTKNCLRLKGYSILN